MEFKRRDKYLVLKWEDIYTLLKDSLKEELLYACEEISRKRHKQGKKDNRYVVVNEDEPYAEIVWKLIEMGEKYDKMVDTIIEDYS